MLDDEFDEVVQAYRQAHGAFVNGDPEPMLDFFSQRDDVTLANPLGPPHVGREAVENAIREAAAHFKDGAGGKQFEELSRYVTPDLAYIVQLERTEARVGGSGTASLIELRATMIFRREGDVWKVSHRHADPITTVRPITSTIAT